MPSVEGIPYPYTGVRVLQGKGEGNAKSTRGLPLSNTKISEWIPSPVRVQSEVTQKVLGLQVESEWTLS